MLCVITKYMSPERRKQKNVQSNLEIIEKSGTCQKLVIKDD